jgi:hypothetical protein
MNFPGLRLELGGLPDICEPMAQWTRRRTYQRMRNENPSSRSQSQALSQINTDSGLRLSRRITLISVVRGNEPRRIALPCQIVIAVELAFMTGRSNVLAC